MALAQNRERDRDRDRDTTRRDAAVAGSGGGEGGGDGGKSVSSNGSPNGPPVGREFVGLRVRVWDEEEGGTWWPGRVVHMSEEGFHHVVYVTLWKESIHLRRVLNPVLFARATL